AVFTISASKCMYMLLKILPCYAKIAGNLIARFVYRNLLLYSATMLEPLFITKHIIHIIKNMEASTSPIFFIQITDHGHGITQQPNTAVATRTINMDIVLRWMLR
ncbi:hypothetical protein ACJX0J_026744, partial [Zea mays]